MPDVQDLDRPRRGDLVEDQVREPQQRNDSETLLIRYYPTAARVSSDARDDLIEACGYSLPHPRIAGSFVVGGDIQ
jgi:hypothetical protein